MALISRRLVLSLLGGTVAVSAAGAGLGLVACNLGLTQTAGAALRLERLFAGLPGPFDPMRVGHEIRIRFGDDTKLMHEVLQHTPLMSSLNIDCDVSRALYLRDVFTDDFSSGRILEVDRWVLSEAECLTGGLFALAHEAEHTTNYV